MSGGSPTVDITIDGEVVQVPPGTTIYDAAVRAKLNRNDIRNDAVPVLCHRENMTPVAVCRVCVVEVEGEWKLSPACIRQVSAGMKVKTVKSSPRVQQAVGVLTNLLMSDHTAPCEKHKRGEDCELELLARRLACDGSNLPRGPTRDRGRDDSSVVIGVNHNACILCDRCIRGCTEVAQNFIIGRMNKGYASKIAFDLNDPMGQSNCVSCGECMVVCPTGALTNRDTVGAKPWADKKPPAQRIDPEELEKHPLFRGVSPGFLKFNEGAIVRRQFKKGQTICEEGAFEQTAFFIEQGSVTVYLKSPMKHAKSSLAEKGGFLRRFSTRWVGRDADKREEESTTQYIHIDAPVALEYSNPVATLKAGELFGEMSCMSMYPRSATVVAAEDCTVLEMLRNALYIIQRNKASRAKIEELYKRRSLDKHLRSVKVFSAIAADEATFTRFADFLRDRVQLKRVEPNTVVCRQGDRADSFYMIRVGFVKVSQAQAGAEHVLSYLGPGAYFGEIGLLSSLPDFQGMVPPGIRTATCTAMDHVDLIRISDADFQAMLEHFPRVREQLAKEAIARLKENEETRQRIESTSLADFLRQGLFNAQSLLVLDLQKCTRCDECSRACADSHDGVTRLIRDGLRFDRFLVASSCRCCLDPYCMLGCPVTAIRRRGTREIIIEDWCIGCGKCAENCPYGNINMHPVRETRPDPTDPSRRIAVMQEKATVCDLCIDVGGTPSCVYACPHDAAHRMAGPELLQHVQAGAR
jgi:CRP-like cAMP-binding protein/NAD-dependent dihydropyrimidine dehydrogenase PreA subunit